MKNSLRKVHLGPVGVQLRRGPDGSIFVEHSAPLGDYPDKITERLVQWADRRPEQVFLSFRLRDGTVRKMTYRETHEAVRKIGQALLDRNLGPQRPVAIISENDVEYALLVLAALYVGVPAVPVSPNYSLLSTDFVKLKEVMDKVRPGLVYAGDGQQYREALLKGIPADAELVVARNPPERQRVTLFGELLSKPAGSAVDAAYTKVGPDTVAKILFTSGSTGVPKGVVFPHRMLAANQQQQAQTFAFLMDEPPVLVDWLPWHHTFGGNSNFGMVLYGGGTLNMDYGRPMPGLIEPTVQTLREVAPTFYLNVPKGFEALLPYLKNEKPLREKFFSRLNMLQYGAASMPHHIWDALDELAIETCGERILLTGGLGSTECGPLAMFANWEPPARTNTVGLPVPGMQVKLVPAGDKLEVRMRGPSVAPAYWDRPDLNDAWDEEGYFRTYDAVRFVDQQHPENGFYFDGRISEDFKLGSGTWVNVAALRANLLAGLAPFVADAVITGHGRNQVCAIIFPDLAGCRALCPDLPASAGAEQVLDDPRVRSAFAERLAVLARNAIGSSTRVERIVLEGAAPTLDNGELADKGTVSQRRVLELRSKVVDELYRIPAPARVIVAT